MAIPIPWMTLICAENWTLDAQLSDGKKRRERRFDAFR